MTPRFPTSPRFRRHQRTHFFRPLLIGLVVGGGLFFLFRSKTPDPVEPEAKPPQEQAVHLEKTEQKRSAGVVVPVEEKPKSGGDVQQPSKSNQKMVPIALHTLASQSESKPVEEPGKSHGPANTPLSGPSGATESKLPTKPVAKSPAKPESRSKTEILPVVPQADDKSAAGTPKETSKETPKETPLPLRAQPKQEDEEEGGGTSTPPLPEALLPKLREPEMDLTFYKSLATKKVILPEEPTGKKVIPPFLAASSSKPTSASKENTGTGQDKTAPSKPSTDRDKLPVNTKKSADDTKKPTVEHNRLPDVASPPDTSKSDKKSYQVQIAIFADMKRATALADQLRSQGAVGPRVSAVKYSSGRTLFRVRLGPFSSQKEAAKSAQRWQAAGQSALIFSDD